ncbi:MAG: nicotinate (nicotinamide) nucleotide adenylyltransferase [Candidatus Delongbacteria bacterium]|nr:nicotinate (nicotinamide) nucleotide adenylyltransferase [Candidatus Delongbacteria bacterium]
MKLGFFGGSFDPLHLGHVIPLLETREFLGLDRIILIPSSQKIFRNDEAAQEPEGASPCDRLNMLREFCRDYPFMAYDDYEIRSQRLVYSIETVQYLLEHYHDDEPVLIIGRDNFERFHEWREYRRILELIPVAVMDRKDGMDDQPLILPGGVADPACFRMIPNRRIEISSTLVRQWCRCGRPIEWLVPASVVNYIHQHHLYGV